MIIPQAMRVIIPPLTSQYLNLTKTRRWRLPLPTLNLVSVFAGTALNQVGKEDRNDFHDDDGLSDFLINDRGVHELV